MMRVKINNFNFDFNFLLISDRFRVLQAPESWSKYTTIIPFSILLFGMAVSMP